MAYTPQTRLDSKPQGGWSADGWYETARQRGAKRLPEVRAILNAYYGQSFLNPDILACQFMHETGWATSYWFEARLNVAGIGITGDPAQNAASKTWTNGTAAARAHMTHVWLYARGTTLPAGFPGSQADDPRWDAAVAAGYAGTKPTIGSLTNTWAIDSAYADKLVNILNQRPGTTAPDTGDNEQEAPMPYSTNIPGLSGGPLETSFPINVDLIATWRTNNRPGLKLRGTFETCQHATANSDSNARQEANYLRNGAAGRYASWHATMDEVGCEITLPLDEVGYHASDGAGPGNYGTVACELTQRTALVNDAVLWRRARRNAAEFMGKVAARKGSPPPGKFHHDYAPDKKWCPAILLNNSTWVAEYHADYRTFYDMEKAAMGESPAPSEPDTIEIGDTLRAVVRLNMRQSASVAAPIITTLDVGAEVVVSGRWTSADGYGWLPVRHTLNSGTVEGYVAQGDASGPYLAWVKSAPAPEPEPEYVAAVPIPALLDTDLGKYDTAEGITTDDTGNEFIFVADVIEFVKETIAGEYALPKPRPVHKPYQPGERAIAAWLVKAKQDGAYYYVLAGGDNEWIRVPYASTKRISDAPLLGDDMHADAEPEVA